MTTRAALSANRPKPLTGPADAGLFYNLKTKAMNKVSEKEYQKALDVIRRYEAGLGKITPETKLGDIPMGSRLRNPLFSLLGFRCARWNEFEDYWARDKFDRKQYDAFKNTAVKELERLSLSEFKKRRNVWKKTVAELQEICDKAGIKMLP